MTKNHISIIHLAFFLKRGTIFTPVTMIVMVLSPADVRHVPWLVSSIFSPNVQYCDTADNAAVTPNILPATIKYFLVSLRIKYFPRYPPPRPGRTSLILKADNWRAPDSKHSELGHTVFAYFMKFQANARLRGSNSTY